MFLIYCLVKEGGHLDTSLIFKFDNSIETMFNFELQISNADFNNIHFYELKQGA